MENNIKPAESECERGGGWEKYWSIKKASVFYQSVWNYFDYP